MPPIQIVAPPQIRERGEKEAEVRPVVLSGGNRRASNNGGAGAGGGGGGQHRDNGSLNHLLGFTLPPRQHPPPRTSRRSGAAAGRQYGQWINTRERYTNAQYRFMLKPTGDYTVHFADPDIYFNWPDVLQVIVPTSSVLAAAAHTFEGPTSSAPAGPSAAAAEALLPSCPICLSEPVAPRMTKCGHIFCYPCLLHYLELAEGPGQKARSCPICFDTVYARELKSVKWFDPVSAASESEAAQLHALQQQRTDAVLVPHDGSVPIPSAPSSFQSNRSAFPADDGTGSDYITMRLIQRTTISTLALPRSPTWPSELIPPHTAPWHFAPDILSFSRFMLATPDYMQTELRKDLSQLVDEATNLLRLGTPADDLGLVFIEAARRKVAEQIEKVEMLRTDHVQHAFESAWLDYEALRDRAGAERRRKEMEQERILLASTTASASETDDGGSADNGYIPPDAVLRGSADRSAYSNTRATTRPQPQQRNNAAHPSAHLAPPSPAQSRGARQRRNVNPPAPNDATYLFYQAASGQHIYLSPLDIKILKSHLESYDSFPLTIRVRVEGVEEGSMNAELRKRCRYLAHLPEACDITFVEADLARVITDPTALAPYAQALRKRAAKRRDKAKRDDRARTRAEQAQAEKERETYMTSRERRAAAPSYHAARVHHPEDEGDATVAALYPTLSREMADLDLAQRGAGSDGNEDAAGLSTSPSDGAAAAAAAQHASKRTVWGTRAVQASAADAARDSAEQEAAAADAWNDFDLMQQRGGRRQGRKKKVVLNLSGGAVQMRR